MSTGTFDFSSLSTSRTYTLPDATGTLALTTGSASIVTVGTISTGVWHGTKVGLAYGGTDADLSATGGAGNVLQQLTTGADITVGALTVSQSAAPATGATVTVTAHNGASKTVYIHPAGTLATLTLALADGLDGQHLTVLFTTAITTLTITGNFEDPATRIGPPIGANNTFVLTWVASTGKWEVVTGSNF